jgi:acetate kinase
MGDAVLVVNAGSSSIKFAVFLEQGDALEPLLSGRIEDLYGTPHWTARNASGAVLPEPRPASAAPWRGHDAAIDQLAGFVRDQLGELGEHALAGVGHRVAHGGTAYARPIMLTDEVLTDLEQLVPLAPLHQPHNLKPIRLLMRRQPQLRQVACFDTAFHRGQPETAQAFALPPEITDRGVRRYGFHGLSYEYIMSVLPRYDQEAAHGRVVVLHLGNGASMSAVLDGQSIANTMGFTGLDGLPMGTRSGGLDPGVLLYLLSEVKLDVHAIEDLLYHRSGLFGVSGISGDMRTLLASTDPRAAFAVELFVYRIARELGSLAAALGGLDALVFTAGIGENAPAIRERVCRAAAWLGVEIDPAANSGGHARISTARSAVAAWVIPTNEELVIARHTCHLLGSQV